MLKRDCARLGRELNPERAKRCATTSLVTKQPGGAVLSLLLLLLLAAGPFGVEGEDAVKEDGTIGELPKSDPCCGVVHVNVCWWVGFICSRFPLLQLPRNRVLNCGR
ncbi:hypothetical protein F5Y14DRAFT_92391 [Nemania sp. NC0429]|nr:hypothetical protein F5Y14DRAFT_92391 [Nemania sp. NC0429]